MPMLPPSILMTMDPCHCWFHFWMMMTLLALAAALPHVGHLYLTYFTALDAGCRMLMNGIHEVLLLHGMLWYVVMIHDVLFYKQNKNRKK
jgi:hypothetical protein